MTALLPETGRWWVDIATRVIGLDLFVEPRGVRSLAEHWLASFTVIGDPVQVSIHIMEDLLETLLGLWALRLNGESICDLSLMLATLPGKKLTYAVRLFGRYLHERAPFEIHPMRLALSQRFFQHHNRHRTLEALGDLVAPETKHHPFLQRTRAVVGGELELSAFRGNPILDAMLDPLYLIVALIDVFAETIAQLPCFRSEPTIAHPIISRMGGILARKAERLAPEEAASILASASLHFNEHAGNVHELKAAIAEWAAPWYKRKKMYGIEVMRATQEFEVTQRALRRARRQTRLSPHQASGEAGIHGDLADAHPSVPDTDAMDLDM